MCTPSYGGRPQTDANGRQLARRLIRHRELPNDEDGLIVCLHRSGATHVRSVLGQAVLVGHLTFTVAERAYRCLRRLAGNRWFCTTLLAGRYGQLLFPQAFAEGWGDPMLPEDWWEY